MKRIISFFLALTMLLGLFSLTVLAVPGTLELSVANVSGAPGSEVEVALNVSTNPGVAWIAVTLDYDKAALELVDVTNGSIIKDMDVGINLNWSADEDSTATGTLATLKFKILASTAGEYSVKLKGRECYDMEGDVNLSITNGSITVGCAHKNTTSVPATQPGATTPGYTAGVYCNDCQTYISGHVEVPPTGGSNEDSPAIIVESATARAGKTVTVNVVLKNNPGFAGLNVYLTYSDKLNLVSAENKTPLTFTNGKTMVWDGISDYTEDGILLVLTFEVDDDTEAGEYSVKVNFIEAYTSELDDVNFVCSDGIIEVVDFLYGDANGDRAINTKDIILLRKYVADKDPVTGESGIVVDLGADANGDGTINTKDIILLRKYVADKDPITGESTVVLGPTE